MPPQISIPKNTEYSHVHLLQIVALGDKYLLRCHPHISELFLHECASSAVALLCIKGRNPCRRELRHLGLPFLE